MSGGFLTLSPASWAVLARALAHFQASSGRPLPPELRRLIDQAAVMARSGQVSARSGQPRAEMPAACKTDAMDPDQHIDMKQAAELAGVSERTLRRRIAEGELPSAKLHGRRVVKVQDLQAWIEQEV